MSDLVQPIKDGVVQQTKTETKSTKSSGSELGKDSFLQLLATQMKYQDPLNPSSDTEYVAQLASFSQLEQLQNLSTVSTNSQAFNLVGKDVVIKTENTAGDTTYIDGKVDFVNMSGTKAMLSVNGSTYSIDQLDSVIDDTYLTKQGLPGVTSAVALKYDASNPKDLSFNVKLGSGDTIADDIRVVINDNVIDSSKVSISAGKVTVKASALSGLANGSYKVTVAFNDPLLTTVKDKVTLQVSNATTVTSTSTSNTADAEDTTPEA